MCIGQIWFLWEHRMHDNCFSRFFFRSDHSLEAFLLLWIKCTHIPNTQQTRIWQKSSPCTIHTQQMWLETCSFSPCRSLALSLYLSLRNSTMISRNVETRAVYSLSDVRSQFLNCRFMCYHFFAFVVVVDFVVLPLHSDSPAYHFCFMCVCLWSSVLLVRRSAIHLVVVVLLFFFFINIIIP